MKSIEELKKEFAEGLHDQRLKEIYVDEKRVPYNRERYIKALDRFKELYGDKPSYSVHREEARCAETIQTTRTARCLPHQ